MSTPPRILELQLSFIWTETYETLLTHPPPAAPMRYLGDEKAFALQYENIRVRCDDSKTKTRKELELKGEPQADESKPPCVTRPWQWWHKYIHHFWQYYLENKEPNRLNGAQAWKYLVPLRLGMPFQIQPLWPSDGPKCKFIAEGFFYPHGVAVVLRPRLLFTRLADPGYGLASPAEPGTGLMLVMDFALQLAKELTLSVTLPDGTKQTSKLDVLAQNMLNYLRDLALGKEAEQGTSPSDPLTVATVIQGRGGDATLPIVPNSNLHYVLEGLCSWDANWATRRDLEPLGKANLLHKNSPIGHIVYHLKRGRAVWMPNYFASPPLPQNKRKLSCYHRNVTLALIQTEMLAQVVVLYSDYLDRGEAPSPTLELLAQFAAIRLGYLYGSVKKGSKKYTYNSATPRFYIEENGYVETVNDVRKTLGLSPLAYTPW